MGKKIKKAGTMVSVILAISKKDELFPKELAVICKKIQLPAGTILIYLVRGYQVLPLCSGGDNHPSLTDGEVKALTSSYLHNKRTWMGIKSTKTSPLLIQ